MNKLQLDGVNLWDTYFFTNASGIDYRDKLLYIYLLTNTLSNPCGIYKISNNRIAFNFDCTVNTVEGMLKSLRYHKQVYRFGPYIIIRDASLFIKKPTKTIKKEWNKIIDKLPLKVKEKLVKIKYKDIDGKPFTLAKDEENTPILFDKEELKKCFVKVLEKDQNTKVEDKKDDIQKEGEGINPPKNPRKELTIEIEEDERKKELQIPERTAEKQIEKQAEISCDNFLEKTEAKAFDDSQTYFTSYDYQEAEEARDEYKPSYVPSEEEYLKEWERYNLESEDNLSSIEEEADACYINTYNELMGEEIIDEDIFMDINCNSEDKVTEHKIVQHLEEFKKDEDYYQIYRFNKSIADAFIEKNKKIMLSPNNQVVEYNAYLDLFWTILQSKKEYKLGYNLEEFLSHVVLDFLNLKGFYTLEFMQGFSEFREGEGNRFISKFASDELMYKRKFNCKKAMKRLLHILYDFIKNGEDKKGALLQWYKDHYEFKLQLATA